MQPAKRSSLSAGDSEPEPGRGIIWWVGCGNGADAEQRMWRTLTRSKHQLVRDRIRLQNQLEALLEEARIKLSSVISDLLGVSGRRILAALSTGETDPVKLAELGDDRLKCSKQELVDALQGSPEPIHLEVLKLYLKRLALLDEQIEALDALVAKALKSTRRR